MRRRCPCARRACSTCCSRLCYPRLPFAGGLQLLLLPMLSAASTLHSGLTLHEDLTMAGGCANNKTLHLIRHAEGWHNVDEIEAETAFTAGAAGWRGIDFRDERNVALRDKFGIAWTLLEQVTGRKYHDPHLTPKGREQAYSLRSRLRQDLSFAVDVVALSPMRRTIETALLALPTLEAASSALTWSHGDDPPRPPSIVATDLLRERCAHFMPDSRLPRSALERVFGSLGANATIDFTSVEEADALFADGSERHEPEVGSALLAARAAKALNWLATHPGRNVAVVSHRHFLAALVGLSPSTISQRPFQNAERRTALLCVPVGWTGASDDSGLSSTHTIKPVRARIKPLGEQLNDAA